MPAPFTESRITFHFDASWRIIRLDKTHWYKHVAGQGMKAVDMIGIRGDVLWLFEVKNYTPVDGKLQPSMPTPDELVQAVSKKNADAMLLLRSIVNRMEQEWYFRWWRRLISIWKPLQALTPEWKLWLDAADCLMRNQSVSVFFCIGYTPASDCTWPSDWIIITDPSESKQIPGLKVFLAI